MHASDQHRPEPFEAPSSARQTSAKSPRVLLGVRILVWMELVVFFAAALVLDAFINEPAIRFSDVSPHPFWIPVLLCSVYYGTKEGWLATFMASVVLLWDNVPTLSFGQEYYDYLFLIGKTPLLWLIASTVLGELALQQKSKILALRAMLDKAHSVADALTNKNAVLAREYSRASQILVDRAKSPIALLQSIPTLFGLSTNEVLQGLDNSVRNLFDPEAFAVLRFTRGTLVPLHNDDNSRHLLALMETTQGIALRKRLMADKKLLSIADPAAQPLLQGVGLFAAPLWDEHSGKVFGMLLINAMKFEDVHAVTLAELTLLCECANKSLSFTVHHERQSTARSEESWKSGVFDSGTAKRASVRKKHS